MLESWEARWSRLPASLPADRQVLKFSEHMKEERERMLQMGYAAVGAKVAFLVYWYSEEKGKEVLVVLPEVGFLKGERIEHCMGWMNGEC